VTVGGNGPPAGAGGADPEPFMPGPVEPPAMAQSVPLFRLVVAVLASGGVAGYGAVLVAPRLGIQALTDVEPFVAGVAGGLAALAAWLVGAVLAVTALDGVVTGFAAVLLAGYAVAAVPLALLAAVAAWRRLDTDDSGAALARWVALSLLGFAVVVPAVSGALGAVMLSF